MTLSMSTAVLSDLWVRPARRSSAIVRDAVLVTGFTALTALAAQVKFALPFTPVPVTGQTFAVLLAGAALGARKGAASQLAYWLVGMLGMPVYADAKGGWDVATGATMGYLVGFVVAAWVVGRLAEQRQDRRVLTSVPAMLFGTAVIYTFGVAWLAIYLDVPVATGESNAITMGLTPFLLGDALKLVLAAMTTASAWRFVDAFRSR
jgi:biotin transport system substrate-specific component